MSMEQLVEWELAGETEVVGENLPKCHFVHHKFHMTWDGTRASAVESLNYGTVQSDLCNKDIPPLP
jgi:hypothetical protein